MFKILNHLNPWKLLNKEENKQGNTPETDIILTIVYFLLLSKEQGYCKTLCEI